MSNGGQRSADFLAIVIENAKLLTWDADRGTIAVEVKALRAVLDEVRQNRDRWHEAATRVPEPHRPWWRRLTG